MATMRSVSMRSCIRSLRQGISRPHLSHPFARRGFSNTQSKKSIASGDAVWAAGSIAVTIPACWYLLSNRTTHQDHHGGHEENDKDLDIQTEELELDESDDIKEKTGENDENEAKQREIGASNEQDSEYNKSSQITNDEEIPLKQSDEAIDLNPQSDKQEDSCNENASHPNTSSGSSG